LQPAIDSANFLDAVSYWFAAALLGGRRFEVWKHADKTCDEATGGGIRKLENAVHLKELRCSGDAHGGCDAACLLFWREEWAEENNLVEAS